MTPTPLNENSLELTIMAAMTGVAIADLREMGVREVPQQYDPEWWVGKAGDYHREFGIDVPQLLAFLQATQPGVVEGLGIGEEGSQRVQFLQRLSNKIAADGVIRVLRKGFSYNQFNHIVLYYPTPTAGNETAAANYRPNRFSITRQLRYSTAETARALDLAAFLNGFPIFTFELKNTITNQNVQHAMTQYKRDRPISERLFKHGVCIAHFAVDDQEVYYTTKLAGNSTTFLPFNKGYNDGAGNPPNPAGIKTDYLWKKVFQRDSLAQILESFVQQIDEKAKGEKRTTRKIIFPRYHQLDAVRALTADIDTKGVGQRYLVQHSAGSGKSNTIAWLAYQLVSMKRGDASVFDSVIVVTDRRVLDTQINNTIKSMSEDTWMIGHAEQSSNLRELITQRKRLIITTIQKFPFILEQMGDEHRGNTFALILDEAHSSQGGSIAGKMNQALRAEGFDNDEEVSSEDMINAAMEGRRMLPNASYFAFTATPKTKTLEMFGEKQPDGSFDPFHSYTMKQAIDEGFILDVLRNYTSIRSYYHLIKVIEDDPEFDSAKARKALRRYVEGNSHTIATKAEIIVDDFTSKIGNLNGQARAIVATQSVDMAIKYWKAINEELARRNWPWRTIVAYAGERMVDGVSSTEGVLNGFSTTEIPEKFKQAPYRMLIVADKFLTGFDEPLLQAMYVDKILSGVKAVQALSRLNRAHPGKKETFVLDFANDPDLIVESFQPFYRTTVLSHETDPNKLYELRDKLDDQGVYTEEQVIAFVEQYLQGVERPVLDAMLDTSVERYRELDEDGQVSFKGNAKAFVRSYNFLSQILPWANAEWERLAIFLTYLTPRLPAPVEDDFLPQEILDAIDLDSYRTDKQTMRDLILEDEDGMLDPMDPQHEGGNYEPEREPLSVILESFNAMFADEHTAEKMRELVVGPMSHDKQLLAFVDNSSEQNIQAAFARVLENLLFKDYGAYSEVLSRLEKDQEFKDNFNPIMYRLWRTSLPGNS